MSRSYPIKLQDWLRTTKHTIFVVWAWSINIRTPSIVHSFNDVKHSDLWASVSSQVVFVRLSSCEIVLFKYFFLKHGTYQYRGIQDNYTNFPVYVQADHSNAQTYYGDDCVFTKKYIDWLCYRTVPGAFTQLPDTVMLESSTHFYRKARK